MLGPALTLTLLVLTGRQSQASLESPNPKLVLSGARLQLPISSSIQAGKVSIKWKVRLRSAPQVHVLTWRSDPDSHHREWECNPHLKYLHCFIMENQTLVIEAAQPRDSGIYFLETSNESGETDTLGFNVSVLDPVGTPLLRKQREALDGGKCRVTLSCSVSGGGGASYGDVSYTWYRGSERIPGLGNLSTLQEQIAGGPHTYTCEVSNFVSWANQTLRLSQGCLQEVGLKPWWLIIVSLAPILLLGTGTLAWVCVRRRRRKRADPFSRSRPSWSMRQDTFWTSPQLRFSPHTEPSPVEPETVYEEVNNLRARSGHEQRQEERDCPMAGTTIYSMILAQPSDFTSQKMENTLYSVVQYSQKSGSKKRKQGPSLTCTIYDEIGKTQANTQSPVLTRKELENLREHC